MCHGSFFVSCDVTRIESMFARKCVFVHFRPSAHVTTSRRIKGGVLTRQFKSPPSRAKNTEIVTLNPENFVWKILRSRRVFYKFLAAKILNILAVFSIKSFNRLIVVVCFDVV